MTSDLDLLQQFAWENSQDAFTEIVRRHLNLVYSAALRQARSPQLAEEIAQSVFADLARNAGKLSNSTGGPPVLTAWLYTVTRRTAIDVIRKESRRQLREQIAIEIIGISMKANTSDWTQIEPFLDQAMDSLDETDRSAILLRYFENKNLREVGETLGTNDDAAQKRVSRALERLREFFSKRKITIGASGLAVLISTNAVQSAPIGLAATISAAAVLAGSAIHTSTLIAATKTIAVTTLQKILITAALAAAVGTGIFEAHQASQLREQNGTLRQQQTSLSDQTQQLQRERDDATNQLAELLAENAQLKSNSNESELLKLRGEVAQLKTAQDQNQNDPMYGAIQNWLTKVNLLKQRLNQMPQLKIPELQFLTDRDWLNAANSKVSLISDDDYRWDLRQLRDSAEDNFAGMAMNALQRYIQANNGQFPTNLSQLQPYFPSPVDDAILERYEIVPAKTIPSANFMGNDWLIAQKSPVDGKNDSREVIGSNGFGHPGNSW
jgi:RNA polymerase sigma factor (sigma-70 family)